MKTNTIHDRHMCDKRTIIMYQITSGLVPSLPRAIRHIAVSPPLSSEAATCGNRRIAAQSLWVMN